MKTNRIISFTLINAFILLGFASLLAGCQKKLYPSQGHIKHPHKLESKKLGRSIASVGTGADRFLSFQDPAQIYIYCSLNSKDKNSCYSKNLQASINKYQEKFGKLGSDELELLLDSLSLSKVEKSTQSKLESIVSELEPSINESINEQHKFCKNNSKHFFKKCMEQSAEKDTFKVLNRYHKKNQMNGQEYLYLKNAIASKLLHKVDNLDTI